MQLPEVLKSRAIFKQEQNECAETSILAASLFLQRQQITSRDEFLAAVGKIKRARSPGKVGSIKQNEVPLLAGAVNLRANSHQLKTAFDKGLFPFLVRLCWSACPELNTPERLGADLAGFFANGYEWHVVLVLEKEGSGARIFDPNFSFEDQPRLLSFSELALRASRAGLDWEDSAVHLF